MEKWAVSAICQNHVSYFIYFYLLFCITVITSHEKTVHRGDLYNLSINWLNVKEYLSGFISL